MFIMNENCGKYRHKLYLVQAFAVSFDLRGISHVITHKQQNNRLLR